MNLLDDADATKPERHSSPNVPAVRCLDRAEQPVQEHAAQVATGRAPDWSGSDGQGARSLGRLWTALDSVGEPEGAVQRSLNGRQLQRLEAEVVTGVNRFLGAPRWDVQPLLGTGGFTLVGAHNPDGGSALALTPESPLDTVLATALDPGWLAGLGLTSDDIDPLLVNVPLHRVPVIADAAATRSRLPRLLEARNAEFSVAEPAEPIRLGQWLRAKGKLLFIDSPSAHPEVAVELRELVPHALYTLWGIFAIDGGVRAVPLGGVPNVVVTDRDGHANFHRTLNFSHLVPRASDAKLLFIDVVFHADRCCYGAVPEIGRAGFPAGIVAQTHLAFLVSGTRLDSGELTS